MRDQGLSGPSAEGSPIRVDSADEQYAYLLTHLGEPERWTVVGQRLGTADDGREIEVVSVRMSSGEPITIAFVASESDDFLVSEPERLARKGTGYLETLMETASAFSAANPPHHPGTVARFPVPSAQYQDAIAIPLPVLAVEDGRHGLYAPPRVVVIDVAGGDPVGVGEFPGFDPGQWPPERLGDWPPPTTVSLGQRQLEGMIARMSACWNRVLHGWFGSDPELDVDLPADIRHGLELRAILDLPGLLPYYDELNPGFARWLEQHRG